MNQDPEEPGRRGQRLLDDIEKELAVIRSEAIPANPAALPSRKTPVAPGVGRAEPRVIDTRSINMNADGLRRTQQVQINRKTLQQRLAEVKVPD